MTNLFNNLMGLLQGDTVKNMAQKFGINEDTVQKVMAMGLPMILSGLNKNASQEQGANALNDALDKHDGSLLSNLSSAISSNSPGLMQDGLGILKHVFGGTQQPAQNQIGKSTGVDASMVSNILAMAAPVVMGFLGQQKKQQGLDVNGIVDVVNTTTKQAPQEEMGLIQKFLDKDGDGSVLDDVMDIGSKFLGSFFNNKK